MSDGYTDPACSIIHHGMRILLEVAPNDPDRVEDAADALADELLTLPPKDVSAARWSSAAAENRAMREACAVLLRYVARRM